MIVAGGTYRERCVTPAVDILFGSGGRAALALRDLEQVTLHTFHPLRDDVEANFGPGVTVHPTPVEITFDYLHPLGSPRISPWPAPWIGSRSIEGDRVIRFGCLEGDFIVAAETAVYDPQSGGAPQSFSANGSRADRMALVMNSMEARFLSGLADDEAAGSKLIDSEGADVVVIKQGPAGATVFQRGASSVRVPAYRAARIFKIGSGDVFTAMFAHYWATRRMTAGESADWASRHVADYVMSRRLPRPDALPQLEPVTSRLDSMTVGILADDWDMQTQWIEHEVYAALMSLGAVQVVRLPHPCEVDLVFAVPTHVDGPAMQFLAGPGRGARPCVVFAEAGRVVDAANALGAMTYNDFGGALYGAAWAAK